jgi:predicted AAA+ superfamily ATPase
MLIVSVPASDSAAASPHGTLVEDVEVGGTRGRAALARLKNAIGRVESSWKPAGPDEGFEIVRRRLFAPIEDAQLYKDRDVVAAEFSKMYRLTRSYVVVLKILLGTM